MESPDVSGNADTTAPGEHDASTTTGTAIRGPQSLLQRRLDSLAFLLLVSSLQGPGKELAFTCLAGPLPDGSPRLCICRSERETPHKLFGRCRLITAVSMDC
jgi:hypothetical protein